MSKNINQNQRSFHSLKESPGCEYQIKRFENPLNNVKLADAE